jgi:hypothetical protein
MLKERAAEIADWQCRAIIEQSRRSNGSSYELRALQMSVVWLANAGLHVERRLTPFGTVNAFRGRAP